MNRLTCEEVFRQIDDYLDRELGAEEIRLIDEHLATCASCLREFNYEASVIEGVKRKLRRVMLPRDLLARIQKDLEAAADEDPGPG
jgi:anti-sigma factor (TIGR02949 family)